MELTTHLEEGGVPAPGSREEVTTPAVPLHVDEGLWQCRLLQLHMTCGPSLLIKNLWMVGLEPAAPLSVRSRWAKCALICRDRKASPSDEMEIIKCGRFVAPQFSAGENLEEKGPVWFFPPVPYLASGPYPGMSSGFHMADLGLVRVQA